MSKELTINTSFSLQVPNLQLAWDSVSLGALKRCPRYYQYSIVEGWAPRAERVHLVFGLHYHAGLERYDHGRAMGYTHDRALRAMVLYLLSVTWEPILQRPWASGHAEKNRLSLVRACVWYCEQFGNDENVKTVILANGKPAVELSYSYATDLEAVSGEQFLLCGHIDRIVTLGDDHYIADRKTTTSALGPRYYAGFTPDNQFSGYMVAGQIVWQQPVKGILVDAAQVGATFARFERFQVPRPKPVLDEWLSTSAWWLGQAQSMAIQEFWPQNDKACHHYQGCEYRDVCGRSPSQRQRLLESDFTRRVWDPLQRRGEI